MKRLGQYQRQCLENPTDDLLGLFAYLSRSLPGGAVSTDGDGNYCLQIRSLRVEYSTRSLENGKWDTLGFKQVWPDTQHTEDMLIRDEYLDSKGWIVDEVLGCLAAVSDEANGLVRNFKAAQTPAGVPGYMDSFAIDLCQMYFELQTSRIEYRTDNLARGMRSFASLRLPSRSRHLGEGRIRQIFSEMLCDDDVAKEARRVFGTVSDKKLEEYLRLGKSKITKPFKYAAQGLYFSVWQDNKIDIVSLCKYYAGCGPSLEPRDGGKP